MKKSALQLVNNLKACFTDCQSSELRRAVEPVVAEFLRTILRRERRPGMISFMPGFFLMKKRFDMASEEGIPV